MKPILFNTEMVRAILEGRKTVTRRVVNPQPPSNECVYKSGTNLQWMYWNEDGERLLIEPTYRPGDILYVRETWQRNPYGIGWPYFYKASPEQFDHAPDKWLSSTSMPRKAARLFLRVTDVRVERLQDITDAEAEREGCEGIRCNHDFAEYVGGMFACTDCMNTGWLEPPTVEFAGLWDSTIKKPADRTLYGWAANPWVWVIEFERYGKPEEV